MPIESSGQEGNPWIPEYCLAQLHRPRRTSLWTQADLSQGAAHILLLRMLSIDGLDELPHRMSHVPYAGFVWMPQYRAIEHQGRYWRLAQLYSIDNSPCNTDRERRK